MGYDSQLDWRKVVLDQDSQPRIALTAAHGQSALARDNLSSACSVADKAGQRRASAATAAAVRPFTEELSL